MHTISLVVSHRMMRFFASSLPFVVDKNRANNQKVKRDFQVSSWEYFEANSHILNIMHTEIKRKLISLSMSLPCRQTLTSLQTFSTLFREYFTRKI